jgi:hypothetical protein
MRKVFFFKQVIVAVCFAVAVLLPSCDTPYDILYNVANLTNESLRIDASYEEWISGRKTVKETSFIIAAGKTVTVKESWGVNARDYVPPDKHAWQPDTFLLPERFEKFDIYVGDILLPDSVRYRKNWEYSAKKLLGVYALYIKDN